MTELETILRDLQDSHYQYGMGDVVDWNPLMKCYNAVPNLIESLRLARAAARGMHDFACASAETCDANKKLDETLVSTLKG